MKIMTKDISWNWCSVSWKVTWSSQWFRILSERVKVGNLVSNWHDKKEYVVDIKNFKKALNNGLVLKKVHSVIKFNQKAW